MRRYDVTTEEGKQQLQELVGEAAVRQLSSLGTVGEGGLDADTRRRQISSVGHQEEQLDSFARASEGSIGNEPQFVRDLDRSVSSVRVDNEDGSASVDGNAEFRTFLKTDGARQHDAWMVRYEQGHLTSGLNIVKRMMETQLPRDRSMPVQPEDGLAYECTVQRQEGGFMLTVSAEDRLKVSVVDDEHGLVAQHSLGMTAPSSVQWFFPDAKGESEELPAPELRSVALDEMAVESWKLRTELVLGDDRIDMTQLGALRDRINTSLQKIVEGAGGGLFKGLQVMRLQSTNKEFCQQLEKLARSGDGSAKFDILCKRYLQLDRCLTAIANGRRENLPAVDPITPEESAILGQHRGGWGELVQGIIDLIKQVTGYDLGHKKTTSEKEATDMTSFVETRIQPSQ